MNGREFLLEGGETDGACLAKGADCVIYRRGDANAVLCFDIVVLVCVGLICCSCFLFNIAVSDTLRISSITCRNDNDGGGEWTVQK